MADKATAMELMAFTQFVHTVAQDAGMSIQFDLDRNDTPYNNGRELHLHKINPNWTHDDLMTMRGYITHECNHKQHTNFRILSKPELKHEKEGEENKLKAMWAQLEDHRVDRLGMRNAFQGDAACLSFNESAVAEDYIAQLAAAGDRLDEESVLRATAYGLDLKCRDYLPSVQHYGEEIIDILLKHPRYGAAVDRVLKNENVLRSASAITDKEEGSQAMLDLAKKLIKDFNNQEQQQQKQPGDGEGQEGEDGEASESAEQNGEPSKEVKVSPKGRTDIQEEGKKTQHKMNVDCKADYSDYKLAGMDEYFIINVPRNTVYIGASLPDKEGLQEIANCVLSGRDRRGYGERVRQTLAETAGQHLQNEVRRLLQVRSKQTRSFNQKRGKLTAKDVHRVLIEDAVGYNERVFNKKREALSLDVAVSLLCDYSGSMSGDRIVNAIAATTMLADVLKSLGIEYEIAGFSNPRGSEIGHVIFKEFGMPNRNMLDNMIAGTRIMGNNSDGYNILYAASRLKHRKEKRKVIIVLSDGQPSSHRRGEASMLRDTIKNMPKNIEIIGLGIGTDYGKKYYPTWQTLRSAHELEAGLLNLLRKQIFKI